MRLWSIHPKYLDPAGLNACWREGLLAKHVLEGKTKGYTNHPQLQRFKNSSDPILYINAYLTCVYREAKRRGYSYNPEKIMLTDSIPPIAVTSGQIVYEQKHLIDKLKIRNPEFLLNIGQNPDCQTLVHPLFHVIEGDIEEWEVIR